MLVQYWITETENLNQFNTEFNNIKSQLSNLEYQTSQIEELTAQSQTKANIRFFQSAGQNLPSTGMEEGTIAFIES